MHTHTPIHTLAHTQLRVKFVFQICVTLEMFSQTFQEDMANYLPTMNTLMEIAEKRESATLFIDDDISDRITDLNIR